MRCRSVQPRLCGVAILASVLMAGAAPQALAASFHDTSGTDTVAKTLNTGESGIIDLGATLKVSGSKAITIAGGGVTINNAGTIQDTNSTGRAIDTSFSAGNLSLSLTNSGMISSADDAFRINADVGNGSIFLDNSGTIFSTTAGQALDWAAITSANATITIDNDKGGVIKAGGADAIRPGSGTIVINNDGLIDSTASANRAINLNTSTTANIKSFSLTNGVDGVIQSQGDAVRITATTLSTTATGTISIDNFGTIQSTGSGANNGQAIDFNDLVSASGHITITNEAGGVIQAADADAIRPGTDATVNNYGKIIGASTGDTGNDGIDFQATGTGTVNNYAGGSITGARHGITGEMPVTVYNEGTITGQNGSGINLDTASNTTATVTNKGTITGNAVTQDGDGIDIDGLATINNYGTIKTNGTVAGEINEGLALGGGTINNYAGATIDSIQRAITIDDSNLGNAFGPTTIYNEGTIIGEDGEAISITSTFANTLTNKGVITGSIAMGAGNDTINLYTGSTTGALDGGAGTDTLNLYKGTGTGTLSNVSNVEALNVQSGSWTLAGTQSYANGVGIAAGATANVTGTINGDVTNNGTVTVHEATVAFNGTFINNGAYISDPASQTFHSITVQSGGYFQAASGDSYKVDGDFANHSGERGLWNTDGAALEFEGTAGTSHDLQLAGTDYGQDVGLTGDFKWGTLAIDAGNALVVQAGDTATQTALYIAGLIGANISGNIVTNITGAAGLKIYYDPTLAVNAYLDSKNYELTGGGELIANVPEPAGIALVLTGLGAAAWRRRRRSAGLVPTTRA